MDFTSILNTETPVHFIGIGGISMSALAEILLGQGYKITGSDIRESAITSRLRHKGIKIYIGHNESNVIHAGLVVYTAAIKDDNQELMKAKAMGIPLMDRATLLGLIMKQYKYSIAVSGSHGKTTTTSLLSVILNDALLDPTVLIGGEVDAIGGNVRIGQSPYFITEACEYVESFLKFFPYIGVILNIDADHLDYFKSIDHVANAFLKFAKLIPEEGYAVVCYDDIKAAEIADKLTCNVITYGINKNSKWMARNITFNDTGNTTYDLYYKGSFMDKISLNIPGTHNIYNSLAAIAVARIFDINFSSIKKSLLSFNGTHRRFEFKGSINGIKIIDDYAHHPTEIKATLEVAKKLKANNVWCIFQPHTYTRTQKLFNEFVAAFGNADKVVIADIYAAREKDPGTINLNKLADSISKNGTPAVYIDSFKAIENYITQETKPGDLVLTVGAGDVYKVGEHILNRESKQGQRTHRLGTKGKN